MEKTLKVDVVNAEESLFSGNAEFVALPGIEGELGILPGHTPLITLIRPGSCSYSQECTGRGRNFRSRRSSRNPALSRDRLS